MIFQREHIKQIKNRIKTQTRRVNRGKYQIGKDYAVQPCRTCKGIKGMRIVIDEIIFERCWYQKSVNISKADAKAEGNYTPEEFEKKFRELNPKWDGVSRWVFVFHVKEGDIECDEYYCKYNDDNGNCAHPKQKKMMWKRCEFYEPGGD